MRRSAWIVAALLLSMNAGAADLKTSNSLVVTKNVTTGTATATCQLSASGLDRTGTYSGVMLFRYEEVSAAVEIFYVVFKVDPANPVWTETSPGVYSVTATLKRGAVTVTADVPLTVGLMNQVLCDARIDAGSQPPTAPSIYSVAIRHTT